MDEVVLRAPTLADADDGVAVINRASQALRGRDEIGTSGVEGWWTPPPPFDLEADVVVGVRDGGDRRLRGPRLRVVQRWDIWERTA